MRSTTPYEPLPNTLSCARIVLWSVHCNGCFPIPDQWPFDRSHSSICFSSRMAVAGWWDTTRCQPSSATPISAIFGTTRSTVQRWQASHGLGFNFNQSSSRSTSGFGEKERVRVLEFWMLEDGRIFCCTASSYRWRSVVLGAERACGWHPASHYCGRGVSCMSPMWATTNRSNWWNLKLSV